MQSEDKAKMASVYILCCGLLILRVANGMTNFSSYLRIVGNVYMKCVVGLSTEFAFWVETKLVEILTVNVLELCKAK